MVQSEASPGCVEAYAYHAQGGKRGTLDVDVHRFRKPIQHTLAVSLRDQCFVGDRCWEMVEVVYIFFDLRVGKLTHQ